MMRFVFLAALASTFMPSLPLGLKGFTLSHLTDAKSGNFNDICKWFCAENDYEDYSFFRSLDHVVNPRIFCELCKKKTTSTTSQTTTSAVTTTQNTSTSETTLKPTTMSERTTIMPTTGPTTPTTQPTAPTTQPTTPTTSTTTPEVTPNKLTSYNSIKVKPAGGEAANVSNDSVSLPFVTFLLFLIYV